jgi:hypothetical protein
MISQSMIQKSKEIYLFTTNSQFPSHCQKVFNKVDHQNVTDAKAGNVLRSEQNVILLYSVSKVGFCSYFDLETQAYEKYFDPTLYIL